MLSPKKQKHRKVRKGRISGNASSGSTISFGSYALMSVDPMRVMARQIEAARRAISRSMKRVGTLYIRCFPHTPVSSKPAEVRMGGGKGSPSFYVAKVKPGTIIFELEGVTEDVARVAFSLAAAKLPCGSKFLARGECDYAISI